MGLQGGGVGVFGGDGGGLKYIHKLITFGLLKLS